MVNQNDNLKIGVRFGVALDELFTLSEEMKDQGPEYIIINFYLTILIHAIVNDHIVDLGNLIADYPDVVDVRRN